MAMGLLTMGLLAFTLAFTLVTVLLGLGLLALATVLLGLGLMSLAFAAGLLALAAGLATGLIMAFTLATVLLGLGLLAA
jgi:hypothetical protein